jgi:hypothetical protein
MDFYATLLNIFRKNRYSVGIYLPKGVGEGKKPGFLEGDQRGIGRMRVSRNLHPRVHTHCLVGDIYLEGGWMRV